MKVLFVLSVRNAFMEVVGPGGSGTAPYNPQSQTRSDPPPPRVHSSTFVRPAQVRPCSVFFVARQHRHKLPRPHLYPCLKLPWWGGSKILSPLVLESQSKSSALSYVLYEPTQGLRKRVAGRAENGVIRLDMLAELVRSVEYIVGLRYRHTDQS